MRLWSVCAAVAHGWLRRRPRAKSFAVKHRRRCSFFLALSDVPVKSNPRNGNPTHNHHHQTPVQCTRETTRQQQKSKRSKHISFKLFQLNYVCFGRGFSLLFSPAYFAWCRECVYLHKMQHQCLLQLTVLLQLRQKSFSHDDLCSFVRKMNVVYFFATDFVLWLKRGPAANCILLFSL